MGFTEFYHMLFVEMADPRSKDWMLMSSPLWPLGLISAYLFIVLVAGPRYMKNRAPLNLDNFNFYYNIYQVAACFLLVYTVLARGWATHYTLGCQQIDYSDNPDAVAMLEAVWWTMMLKLSECVETIVFVLKKKDRQVSFLHVYHHASTFLLGWLGTKYIGGGMATFPIIPNSIVHIVMYSYYLLSISKNSEIKTVLSKIKPYITVMQMVQFVIIIAHAMQAFMPGCDVPHHIGYVYIPNVFLIFYLFYQFYKENYTKAPKTASKVKVAKAS